jgi:predicted ATPase/DNA-binding CsgD family transcriptional regulator
MQHSVFEPLTRREREILILLGKNLSDREIADCLFVAPTTVKWFNRQIFKKLGVENRQEAIQRATSLGILVSAEVSEFKFTRNLPAQLMPFIGRVKELSDLRHSLQHPNTRLITILAPGGMGKTRLAVQVATAVMDNYADGVCFAPLAGLTSSDPFISTVIEALGLQFAADGRSSKQQLFDALRRKQLLFVLDNFEHLIDSAPLVTEMLIAAPQVKVLTTSRERLNISAEIVYPLTGLALDDSNSTLNEDHDAGQLFALCAQRANLHFIASDVQSITRVCKLVQGMPLAIELAAAWAGTLSPAEIATEVERSADFLRTTMRDAPERLRSVRVVFEAAWARLTDDARQAFRRLSVFRGGFTLEAALTVTGKNAASLAILVDRALLWRNSRTDRYEIHELLRQYAEQQLDLAVEADLVRQKHHQYFAKQAAKWGAEMLADKQLEGMISIDADEENIREALTYATICAAPDMIEPFADLWNYYDMRSRWEDGDKFFLAACDALEPHDSLALAKLLTGRAVFYERLRLWEQEYEVAKRGYEMTLRLGVDARHTLPLAMITYADSLRDLGRQQEALTIYHEAMPIAQEVNLPLMVATLTFHLALNAEFEGRREVAKATMTEAYRMARKLKNHWGTCFILFFLARIAANEDRLDEAEQLSNQILEIARPIRFNLAVDFALSILSLIASERGDWQSAYQLSLESLQIRSHTAPGDQILIVLSNLAEAALMLNDNGKVRQHIDEALVLLREWGVAERVVLDSIPNVFIRVLCSAGELLFRTGHTQQAVLLFSQAENILGQCNLDDISLKRAIHRLPELLDRCRVKMTQDAFNNVVAHGKTLNFAQLLDEIALIG